MGTVISIGYLLLYIAAGILLARQTIGVKSAPWAVVSLGCGYAVALLAMVPAALALVLGITLTTAVCSGVLVACAGGACVYLQLPQGTHAHAKGRNVPQGAKAKAKQPCCLPPCEAYTRGEVVAFLCAVLPLALLTLYLLHTHVLLEKDGIYYTGQSGYGDVAMHLAFIKSIANLGQMPPSYPLIAGQDLFGYTFLSESVSSIFLVLGAGLKLAYLLPCVPAIISVFGCFWCLARRMLGSVRKATLAYLLFFLGSGFGFCYFLESKEMFQSIFTGYYTTPTNYIQENIRWVNSIADLLVPQRCTLMGWSVLFPALYLLYRFAFEGEKRLWVALALLAGSLPLLQTHSLLALVLLSAVYVAYAVYGAVRSKQWQSLVPWLLYAALAGIICSPQLFGIIFAQTSEGSNFLVPYFNWSNNGDFYLWFYIKNIGLVYLLLLPAFLWVKKQRRAWYAASLLILGISEVLLFQPNPYDNIKLLFIWFLYSCILVADALCDWLAALHNTKVAAVLCAFCVFVGTFGSVLTLGREIVSEYQVFNENDIAIAAYIEAETEVDALFLTGQQHLNPVVCLAGRSILCGAVHLYYHGMNYATQEAAQYALYETPSEELLEEWGIDYVYFSSYERSNFVADEAWYEARYPVVFQSGDIILYAIQ